MTEQGLQQLWKTYQDAWADISVDERRRLLRASVTDNVVFTSPNVDGQGVEELLAHIADFQTRFPGSYFHSNPILQQHGQMLSEWTMFHRDGTGFLTAHSYARFNDHGLLEHLAGFWKP